MVVKAKQLAEVRETVNAERFRSWFDALGKARMAAREASLRHEELLTQVNLLEFRAELAQKNAMDTLYRAASYEDTAAGMQAEANDLENKSLDLVGEFETQRQLCTELWSSMTVMEREAGEKKGYSDARLKRLKDEYEQQTARKNQMWEAVEAMWATSLEKNLAMVETRVKGTRVRQDSEALFAAAEQSTRNAQALKAESEKSAREKEHAEDGLRRMLAGASAQFDAIVHEDFLYWPQRENQRMVYVVPLFADSTHYNIELKSCVVYQVDRNRGVEFLEPVVDPARGPLVDTRLEDFFTKGRPTQKRTQPGA
jgi:hypothetical protein